MTTSGPPGFVLEPSGDDADAARELVLAALAQAFTVSAERDTTRRRTWLDTFDWRLSRAGLVLAHEQAQQTGRTQQTGQAGRAGRLLLAAADSAPLAEQSVTGWPPKRPPLPEQLPAGQVRDRLIPLASPRALLPVVRVVSTVRVTRLLNADGKTVARLVAEHSTVSTPTGDTNPKTADLPLHLAIAEVRGYPAQARKAARLLAGVPGMSPATRPLLGEVMNALRLDPAEQAGGVDAGITAQMPASVAVGRLLLRLLDTLELNVDGVLGDIDTEFLHDLRVAVRRTRAAVKLLADALPADLAGQYGAEFKWLGDLTTPTRDLDVHLLGFDAMTERLVAAPAADLEPFRAFLVRRRAREFRRLAAAMRSPRFRSVTHDWRKALLEVRDATAPGKRTAAGLAANRTARVLSRITAEGGKITSASPPESLHDLRKRAKELRYLLEFFAPLHDPVPYRKVLGDLKQLQDCLGEFQDSQVQREEIHALADAMLAERAAPAATLLAMGELAAGLAASQAEARAAFARRFARFAGPAGQERFRALLSGPSGAGLSSGSDR